MRTLAIILATGLLATTARAEPAPERPVSLMAAVIPSTDLARSAAFYTEVFGLKAAGRPGLSASETPLIFPGGGPILLLVKPPAPASPSRRVILSVPDLAAVTARLAAAGHPAKSPPKANPQMHVTVAVAEDPDGNELELVQREP